MLFDLDLSTKTKPFPNLALMKLSAWHKAKGHEVFLNFPLAGADFTYVSCVFTWNARQVANRFPLGAILGGSGLDVHAKLHPEIERVMPDYSLYGANFSMGFTSRGCIRRCPWCIVPEKEGPIQATASIYDFWDRRHGKIVLLDNNLLAAPNWRTTLHNLIANQLEVDFNQGLDIRLVDDENAWYLSRVTTEELRFAFDDIGYEVDVRRGISILAERGIRPTKLSFYALVGFNPDGKEALERLKLLKSYKVSVYPMIYRGPDGKEADLNMELKETILWRGARPNIRKFLRLAGRLRKKGDKIRRDDG